MIRNFALWFFCGFFYVVIPISLPESRALKISLIWLRSFVLGCLKKKTKIQFHLLKLGYWTLSFMIVFVFLSIGLSQSHVAGRELIELT
jgi:hypothetical protein